MSCTRINEPSDPHTWHDNYLCAPTSSGLSFSWSYAGNNCPSGYSSVRILETADPHTWHDNYLCYKWTASMHLISYCSLIEINNKIDI